MKNKAKDEKDKELLDKKKKWFDNECKPKLDELKALRDSLKKIHDDLNNIKKTDSKDSKEKMLDMLNHQNNKCNAKYEYCIINGIKPRSCVLGFKIYFLKKIINIYESKIKKINEESQTTKDEDLKNAKAKMAQFENELDKAEEFLSDNIKYEKLILKKKYKKISSNLKYQNRLNLLKKYNTDNGQTKPDDKDLKNIKVSIENIKVSIEELKLFEKNYKKYKKLLECKSESNIYIVVNIIFNMIITPFRILKIILKNIFHWFFPSDKIKATTFLNEFSKEYEILYKNRSAFDCKIVNS